MSEGDAVQGVFAERITERHRSGSRLLTDAEKASILRSIAHEGSRQFLVLGVAKTQAKVALKGHGPRPGSRTGQMELWSDFPMSIALHSYE